jgi:hypothetical protein
MKRPRALNGKGGKTSIAQSYRFLRMALNVAVSDGALIRNPCRIKGAGIIDSKERPVASPAELVALVEAISPAKYRAAILIGGWVGLRRGEIVAPSVKRCRPRTPRGLGAQEPP